MPSLSIFTSFLIFQQPNPPLSFDDHTVVRAFWKYALSRFAEG